MKKGKISVISLLLSGVVVGNMALVTMYYVDNRQQTYNYPVTRVLDGDTVEIRASYLPQELGDTLKIRILGVDTPEKGRLAKCEIEKKKSQEAKKFVEDTISKSSSVEVILKGWDKYGGRVLGDLLVDGKKLSILLIENGHAIEYHGDKKTKDWCVR